MLYSLIGRLASHLDYSKYEIIDYFRKSGLIHLLAISGIHFFIITFLIFFLVFKTLSLFPKTFIRYDITPIASIITIMTNALFLEYIQYPISGSRAFLMSSYYLLGKAFYLPTSTLRIFSITLLILYFFEKEVTPSISFQLSFSATLALILFFKDKKQTGQNKLTTFISSNFNVSLICYSATLPIIIYHFQHIPLYSLAANVIVVPIFSFLFLPLFFLGEITSLHFANNIFLNIAETIFIKIVHIAKYFSEIPYSYLYIKLNPLALITLWAFIWCKIIFKDPRIISIFLTSVFVFSILFNQKNQYDIIVPRKGKYLILQEGYNNYYIINDNASLTSNNYQAEHYKHASTPILCNNEFCRIIKNDYAVTVIFRKIPEKEYESLCKNSELLIDLANINLPCRNTQTITKRDLWFNRDYYLKLSSKLEIYNNK